MKKLMKKKRTFAIVYIIFYGFIAFSFSNVFANATGKTQIQNLEILMPNTVYSTETVPLEIYYDNLILSQDSDALRYEFLVDGKPLGELHRRKWIFTPSEAEIGQHKLTINIYDAEKNPLSTATSNLKIAPKNAGKGVTLQLLSIGDSLGHQSKFPSRLFEFFEKNDGPKINFLGSHTVGSKVPHEHYGGWQWSWFVNLYDPGNKAAYYGHRDISPFIFLDKKTGKPMIDFHEYVEKTLNGVKPEIVLITLGINDGWALSDDPIKMEEGIAKICQQADLLIKNIQNTLPNVRIAVGMVIPANYNERTFQEIYKGATSASRWKRINYILNQHYMRHFSNRSNIFLIPIHFGIDIIDDYDAHKFMPEGIDYHVNQVVHPNTLGDKHLASAYYSWIKNLLN